MTVPRVFTRNDAEPGPEVDAVTDCEGYIWWRFGDEWRCKGFANWMKWGHLTQLAAPLTTATDDPDVLGCRSDVRKETDRDYFAEGQRDHA